MKIDKRSLHFFINLINIFILFTSTIIGIFININIMCIFISLLLSVNIIYIEYKKEQNIINFTGVFTIFWYFYTNASLMGNYTNQLYLFGINGKVYFLYYLALISYYVSYKAFRISKSKNINFDKKEVIKLTTILAIVALAIQGYYIFDKFGFQNFIFASRPSRALMIGSVSFIFSGTQEFLYLISPLLYLMHIKTNRKSAKIIAILITIYNVSLALIIIDRTNLILAILPILSIMIMYKKISKWVLYLGATIGFFLLVDFKSTMYHLINYMEFPRINFKLPEEFFVSFNICADILDKLNSNELNFFFGKSYIQGFISIIFPLIDIEPLSIWYIRNYYFDIYARGGGLAFSSVGEGYLNFGTLGVFIYYSIIGCIAKSINVKKERNDLFLIIYSLLIPLSYKLFRSEFYSLTKTGFWFWIVPLLFIYYILRRCQKNKS